MSTIEFQLVLYINTRNRCSIEIDPPARQTTEPIYLVQSVLAPHVTSLRASLLHRAVGFFRGLLARPSHEVTVVALLAARDIRSSLGSNLALVREVTGLDPWEAGRGELRAALEAADRAPVPQQDSWRAPALEKLLTARLRAHYAADKGEEGRLQGLINSLVIN